MVTRVVKVMMGITLSMTMTMVMTITSTILSMMARPLGQVVRDQSA